MIVSQLLLLDALMKNVVDEPRFFHEVDVFLSKQGG